MKKTQLKRYLADGWLPKHIAGELLPDLEARRTFARDLMAGVYEQREVRGYKQVKADAVLMLLGKSAEQLLAERFPAKRLHKGECRQAAANITTKTQRETFARNWHRLRQHFGALIASPYDDVSARDLRLFYQVLSLAWRARTFRLCLPSVDLHRLTGLDREDLPKARRRLELWSLLRTERSGNGAWRYTLLNPKTREPFAEPAQSEQPIRLPESWTVDAG